jgi:uncharacterized protein (TIGR02145 family)
MRILSCCASSILFLLSALTFSQEPITVRIGEQEWMTKNLNVSRFRNGDPIPEVSDFEEWRKAGENKTPAWCYYENATDSGKVLGKIYNWHAVNDPRGLAPDGFHVPRLSEWDTLFRFMGFNFFGEPTDEHYEWKQNTQSYNEEAFNNFNFCLAGGRFQEAAVDIFYYLNDRAWFWSATDYPDFEAYCLSYTPHYGIDVFPYYEEFGFSVRCIKDKSF